MSFPVQTTYPVQVMSLANAAQNAVQPLVTQPAVKPFSTAGQTVAVQPVLNAMHTEYAFRLPVLNSSPQSANAPVGVTVDAQAKALPLYSKHTSAVSFRPAVGNSEDTFVSKTEAQHAKPGHQASGKWDLLRTNYFLRQMGFLNEFAVVVQELGHGMKNAGKWTQAANGMWIAEFIYLGADTALQFAKGYLHPDVKPDEIVTRQARMKEGLKQAASIGIFHGVATVGAPTLAIMAAQSATKLALKGFKSGILANPAVQQYAPALAGVATIFGMTKFFDPLAEKMRETIINPLLNLDVRVEELSPTMQKVRARLGFQ